MAEAKDSARLQRELIKITDTPGPRVQPLKAPAPRAAIGQSNGEAPISRSGSGGGGIASPLTEQDYALRTWHGTRSVTDTSGLFTIEYENVNEVVMVDSNSSAVHLLFADEP